jgi:hypothetical protein
MYCDCELPPDEPFDFEKHARNCLVDEESVTNFKNELIEIIITSDLNNKRKIAIAAVNAY